MTSPCVSNSGPGKEPVVASRYLRCKLNKTPSDDRTTRSVPLVSGSGRVSQRVPRKTLYLIHSHPSCILSWGKDCEGPSILVSIVESDTSELKVVNESKAVTFLFW